MTCAPAGGVTACVVDLGDARAFDDDGRICAAARPVPSMSVTLRMTSAGCSLLPRFKCRVPGKQDNESDDSRAH